MPMTAQKIFNTVVTHLHTQGKQAMGKRGNNEICLYRGRRGTSCAVGCLIPDELYSRKMEKKGVNRVFGMFPEVKKTIVGKDQNKVDLLGDLQNAHDDARYWRQGGDPAGSVTRLPLTMRTRLIEIANQWNLKIDVLKKLGYAV